jgi:hypothetical protein
MYLEPIMIQKRDPIDINDNYNHKDSHKASCKWDKTIVMVHYHN